MKILIYGEYSGYGKSLASGFSLIGHEATVFSFSGDGWKNIDVDLTISNGGKLKRLISFIKLIPKLMNHDVVFITNPSFCSVFFGFSLLPILLFKLLGRKTYLLCCGDDVEYIKCGQNGILKKFVYSGVELPRLNYFKSKKDKLIHHLVATFSEKIIPTMYDYEVCWKASRYSNKLTETIPLATECSVVESKIKKTNYENIKILHGINRPDVKGTYVIIKALKRLSLNYKNITVFTPEKLSQSEYLKLFQEIDISIDQCKCHSYGMNGIYSMMYGHVLLAPSDLLCNSSFGVEISPIISIENNENDIYSKLESLIKRRDLDDIKMQSKQYANKLHSPENVAKKILDIIKVG